MQHQTADRAYQKQDVISVHLDPLKRTVPLAPTACDAVWEVKPPAAARFARDALFVNVEAIMPAVLAGPAPDVRMQRFRPHVAASAFVAAVVVAHLIPC